MSSLRLWWSYVMDGRVHAYEVTGTWFERFHRGDYVRVAGKTRRVRGYDLYRDVLYIW